MTKVMRYRSEYGVRHGIITEGRKWIYWLPVDMPVRVHKLAPRELTKMTAIEYPSSKLRQTYRRMAKWNEGGLSKQARDMIKSI